MDLINSYGPFDIPKRKGWVIVGAGKSADGFNKKDYPDHGIIALNLTLKFLGDVDISLNSHYETVLLNANYLDQAEIIFIPDPSHVGHRCVPMDAINLYNFDSLGDNARAYRKEANHDKALVGSYSLYVKHTIATAALHLLYLNGIKKVECFGIDGDRGFADRFKDIYNNVDSFFNGVIGAKYDKSRIDFLETAKDFKIEVKEKVCA